MAQRAEQLEREFSARRRVLAASAAIVCAALLLIRWPVKTWGLAVRAAHGDGVTQFLARCRRLEANLPPAGRIGYYVLPGEAETRKSFHTARLVLMQYALTPRVVENFSGHELVIFDSDDPAAVPSAAEGDWQLLADLHDGLKLFRTTGRP